MLEIPTFIATLSTFRFIVVEYIKENLPEIKELREKYKCLNPSLETLSIFIEPSSHELLYSVNILQDTVEEFFFEIKERL